MSHFTRVKTRMVEKDYLLRALQDLKIEYEEGEVKIRGYGGQKMQVEIRIPGRVFGYDVGYYKNGGFYECIADWMGVRGETKKLVLQKVPQRYAYHAARAKLEEQGFAVASEETQKDGRIHLVLRRAV